MSFPRYGGKPRSSTAQPVPVRSCWHRHLPKARSQPGSLPRGFTPRLHPSGCGREGVTHLCSRSPRLCLPGWWTPGFCHTWHSGSRTCARTAEQEQSLVRQHPGTGQQRFGYQTGSLCCFRPLWQRDLNGVRAFLWRQPWRQPRRKTQQGNIMHGPYSQVLESFRPHVLKSRTIICQERSAPSLGTVLSRAA